MSAHTEQSKSIGVFGRPPSTTLVRSVVFASIALTLIHFTDNTVSIDSYPKASWQPDWFAVVVVVAWFVYAAIGIAAYRSYRSGDFARANLLLVVYGFAVLTSLGHFLVGSPSELTTFALVTIAIDTVAGLVVLGVAAWSFWSRARLQLT
ncbi:MAG TPA: hypothetical protein VGO97_04380 [Solirubrobacterales bacterium]|nr:hypothetical protein [Solirubrobacterales bacterium]